jgi:DNA invertase Pin-like site-specific DNA recombinase
VSTHVIAYLRVSTAEQVKSGAGLAAQRTAIEAWAATRGYQVIGWCIDAGVSGSVAPADRPELARALEMLRTGTASHLLVGRVDRVSRKAFDLLGMVRDAENQGWSLASADGTVDMTTPAGRAMLTTQAAFAELERDLIRARVREALAERRAAGVVLGHPVEQSEETVARIVAEHEAGDSNSQIARRLNLAGITTPRGKSWYPASISQVLRGRLARELAEHLAR